MDHGCSPWQYVCKPIEYVCSLWSMCAAHLGSAEQWKKKPHPRSLSKRRGMTWRSIKRLRSRLTIKLQQTPTGFTFSNHGYSPWTTGTAHGSIALAQGPLRSSESRNLTFPQKALALSQFFYFHIIPSVVFRSNNVSLLNLLKPFVVMLLLFWYCLLTAPTSLG